jgi:hypothetical protein
VKGGGEGKGEFGEVPRPPEEKNCETTKEARGEGSKGKGKCRVRVRVRIRRSTR